MRSVTPAVLAATLLLVGCNESSDSVGYNPPTKDEASTSGGSAAQLSVDDDPRAESHEALAAVESMRTRDERILQRIGRIKKGMTKQEVLDILGEPNRRQNDEWDYQISPLSQWVDETVQVMGYQILFHDGHVKQKNTRSAHYHFAPGDGG